MSLRTFFRLFTHTQMMPILESGEETLVGGQAVMEGVMMRAPHSYCVAVRKADGEIVTEEMPLARMSEKYPIFKLPDLPRRGHAGPGHDAGHEGAASFPPTRRSTTEPAKTPAKNRPKELPALDHGRPT